LTEKEAAAVFSLDWKDKRAYVASLVAATTGARMGECLALRRSDIGTDTLNIAHNYTRHDGLKCPKNGHKRIAPLLPEVRAALLDLLKDSPHTIYDPFIFYSLSPDKPCDNKFLLDGFNEAMDTVNAEYKKAAKKAKLEKPEIFIDYKARNIIFHSWRHWFVSKLTEKIEGEKVAKVSGHLSEAVFKKYADHIEAKNIQAVSNAAKQAFENVIPFRKVG
jgi:integrase